MSSSHDVNNQIQARLEILLSEGNLLLTEMIDSDEKLNNQLRRSKIMAIGFGGRHLEDQKFYNLKTRCLLLLDFMKHHDFKIDRLYDELNPLENTISHTRRLLGVIESLKDILEYNFLVKK